MNELIKYFNEEYGEEYGKVSYPRTTLQIYQVYQIIKDCNIEDNELTDLLHHVKLPKPKTMEEMEMYSECINDGIPQNKMMPQILNEYTIELTADELNNLEYRESMAGDYRVLDFSKYNIDFQKLNKFVIYMGIDFDSLCRVQDSTSYDSIYYDSNYIEYYTNTLNNEMKIYSSEKFTQGRIIKIFEITGYINDMYITPKDNIAIRGFARKNNIAVGEGAIAPNSNSIAIGTEVFAKGNSSCAQGSYVTANGDSSCAQGRGTIARGDYSHAEGLGTETNTVADAAHAEGFQTKASSDYQHVQGKYNIEDKSNKYAHIVGNGKSGMERSNAHTLDWDGNGWYAGKLSQEGTPTEDKDLATKKYVDDSRDNLISNIYGNNIYNFQITEDEFNSLRNLLYNDGNNKIALNSISSDTLNTIIGSHTWYNAISFNKKIILKVKSTGSGGLVVYTKGESTDGHVNYTLLSLKSNESNIVTISHTSFIEYNYNDKIINLGILNNNKVNIQKSTKNQYINATKDFELVLPNVTEYIEIHLYLTPSSTVSITFPPSIKWKDVPTIEANKVYEIIFKYINETIGWIGEYKIYN